MRRARLAAIVLVGCAAAGSTAAAVPADTPPAQAPPPATIPAGVTVGNVPVGGLAPDAAAAAIDDAFAQPLRLVYRRTTILAAPSVLGAAPETDRAVQEALVSPENAVVPLGVTVVGADVTSFVEKLAGSFDRKAQDSRLVLRRLRPWLSIAKAGRRLGRRPATRAIVAALRANLRGPVALPVTTLQPKLTRSTFGPIVVIRRSSNRLYLYRGMRFVRRFVVATGQTRYPTPLGRFSIVVKWKNPWWYPPSSPWAAGQKPIPPGPNNPLGTRWMGLSAPGVGIHGTPSPGSLGYSVSHGCIRMAIPEAEWLFDHVEIGAPVFVVPA
jgi:lipoprotein-anchoring transpeptidase ErfK/SrfK